MKICTCCAERPATIHRPDEDLCAQCAAGEDLMCAECGRELDQDEDYGETLCSRCRARDARSEALDALAEQALAAATSRGWTVTRESRAKDSASRYYTLAKDVLLGEDEDGIGEYDTRELILRVSDHPSLYCREDYSLVVGGGSGNDHTMATWIAALEQ